MTYFLLRIMINALSIAMAVKVVNGITFTGEWWKMIIIGGVFGIVNAIIKPLLTFFTLPLIVLTLGFFTLIINSVMLVITAGLSEPLSLDKRLAKHAELAKLELSVRPRSSRSGRRNYYRQSACRRTSHPIGCE